MSIYSAGLSTGFVLGTIFAVIAGLVLLHVVIKELESREIYIEDWEKRPINWQEKEK